MANNQSHNSVSKVENAGNKLDLQQGKYSRGHSYCGKYINIGKEKGKFTKGPKEKAKANEKE